MMAYVVSEGRLLSLKPFEWLMLLVGAMLCGSLTLLFWAEDLRESNFRFRPPLSSLSTTSMVAMVLTQKASSRTSGARSRFRYWQRRLTSH
jgi:formate hydrogenlyase subunit 3/multisubunit Na+/H+ antiporter MnhD subunit